MSRTLIRGGVVVDGTGAASRRLDLLVDGERVADLLPPGSGTPAVDETFDATGQVVCPGFIDIHSHGDLIFTLPPERQRVLMAGRIAQGITTEIIGNCGLGLFPCPGAALPALRAVVGWMTPPDSAAWPDGGWSDLAGYLERLESGGVWVNVGALQPHGPLRIATGGLSRVPEGDTRAGMARLLREALDAGAFGLSTGLIYPPGIFTTTDEIVDLASIVSERTGQEGFVASHIRGSSETLIPAVEELLETGRRAGVRVQHSHNEAVGRDHWPRIDRVLAMESAARRSGQPVAYDMFPYTAAATMMLAIYPPWALEGGVDALLARLGDPSTRSAIREAIETTTPVWPPWTERGWPHNLVKAVGWDQITIGSVGTARNRALEGSSLAQLGAARHTDPFDAISDLMIEEGGLISQIIHGVSGEEAHEEGIAALLSDPAGAICTDANDFGKGKPHPAAYGTYPSVLGRYVRDRRILGLEEAIRKMTGYPASLLGLSDRGIVRRGGRADLVVFDPKAIGSVATFDAPRRPAVGITRVMVNGVVVHPATGSGRPPGRVIRRND